MYKYIYISICLIFPLLLAINVQDLLQLPNLQYILKYMQLYIFSHAHTQIYIYRYIYIVHQIRIWIKFDVILFFCSIFCCFLVYRLLILHFGFPLILSHTKRKEIKKYGVPCLTNSSALLLMLLFILFVAFASVAGVVLMLILMLKLIYAVLSVVVFCSSWAPFYMKGKVLGIMSTDWNHNNEKNRYFVCNVD